MFSMVIMILLLHTGIQAQYLTLSVDKDKILLGEQFKLDVKLTIPQGVKITDWPSIPDSVNHLEVVGRSAIDSIKQGNKVLFTQQFIMTGFDSGHWVIPPLTAMVNGKEIKSASTAIDVQNIKLTGNDYNDIKEIIEVEPPGLNWKTILLYGLGILLIAALVYYWWMKRKSKTQQTKPISKATAYEEAIKAMAILKQDQLVQKGEVKKYYSRLYDIYRVYIGAVSGKNMMLLTTDDILLDMKELMNGQLFSQTAEVMRISDAVKFAKYVPAQDDALRSMEQIRQTIDELNRQKQ
jgi:hypothetical protein